MIIEATQSRDGKEDLRGLESVVAEHDAVSIEQGPRSPTERSRAADERRRPTSGVCVNEAGFFLIRDSVDHVAGRLDVTRYTIYN